MKKLSLFLILAATALATSAAAQELRQYSLLAPERFVVGARAEYVWWAGEDNVILPRFKKEWAAGLSGAYRMVPNVSLTGRYLYHLDSKVNSFALGLNVKLIDGMDR